MLWKQLDLHLLQSPKKRIKQNQSKATLRCLESRPLVLCISPSKSTCKTCSKKHHTPLHATTNASGVQNVQNNHSRSQGCTFSVLLPTALVDVKDSNDVKLSVRLLLDSGSERSFITESCAQRLGFKRRKQPLQITGIGNSTKLHQSSQDGFHVCSRFNADEIYVEEYVLPKITGGSVTCFSKALRKPFEAIQAWLMLTTTSREVLIFCLVLMFSSK